MNEAFTDLPRRSVVELVPPMDRDSLLEVDYRPGTDAEVYVYLKPGEGEAEGDIFVNAEPIAEELGLPFWLKVLRREKVRDVEDHPFFYSPGKIAVAASYGITPEAA